MSALELFAEELKKKRETLGLSISDLYEVTRIDKTYLEEMEKGNFEIMPDVYMRAFVRKYADAVELNPDEAIAKYEAAQSGKSYDKVASAKEVEKTETDTEYSEPEVRQNQIKENNNNPFIIIGGIVLLLIAGLAYFLFFSPNSEEIIVEQRVEDIIGERTQENSDARFKVRKEENVVTPNSEDNAIDTFSLKINALDTVWFRTEIDNTSKDEFILNPNGSKTLRAKSQINILIGNTGGIEFFLNGKKIDFKGKKGEIRNVIVKADGVHYSK